MASSSTLRPAALGFAAGLRTFTPLAALGLRGRLPGGRWVQRVAAALAMGEWAGDKAPSAPARTTPAPLAARTVSGALAGGLVAGRRGAVLGAAGALVGSYAGQHGRAALVRATGRPDVAVAVGEDALAATLAATASR